MPSNPQMKPYAIRQPKYASIFGVSNPPTTASMKCSEALRG